VAESVIPQQVPPTRYNIKMHLTIRIEEVYLIQLALNRLQWMDLVNTVTDLNVLQKARSFLPAEQL
jgi:hypothetical protein